MRDLNSPIGGFRKRALDFVASLGGLVLLLPLFCIAAALIKTFDGGPIVYFHTRIGYNGRRFGCLKFRTMVVDADKVLEKHRHGPLPMPRREWAETHKLKADPRVTRTGVFLRKTSIDELPQLINVLLGQMSLVGPRPIVPGELEKYAADAMFYVKVRPGLTGPWQVGGRNDTGYEIRVALDREYVETWTLRNDLILILRTIPAVLSTSGSY